MYQLINLLQEYQEAKEKEKKAAQDSMSTLAKLEQDYRSRGEQVPEKVYSERARDILSSLNRDNELRDALEPGSHFFNSLFKFVTFQPANPYENGPSSTFDPKTASYYFKERAPELASPEVMVAFLKRLREFQLPAEKQGQTQLADLQRKDIAEAIQKAFPESYQKAMNAMNVQTMAGLDTAYNAMTKSLTDLQQPVTALPAPLTKTSESATRAASSMDRFSGRLANFEVPDLKTFMAQPGAQGSTFNFSPTPGVKVPSRAAGGIVQSGGFVEVHDREAIVPARVTARWEDGSEHVRLRDDVARAIQREREAAPPPVHVTVTYSPRVEISGHAQPGEIKRLLQSHSHELSAQIESTLLSTLAHHRERS